jgi:hypothetical protein
MPNSLPNPIVPNSLPNPIVPNSLPNPIMPNSLSNSLPNSLPNPISLNILTEIDPSSEISPTTDSLSSDTEINDETDNDSNKVDDPIKKNNDPVNKVDDPAKNKVTKMGPVYCYPHVKKWLNNESELKLNKKSNPTDEEIQQFIDWMKRNKNKIKFDDNVSEREIINFCINYYKKQVLTDMIDYGAENPEKNKVIIEKQVYPDLENVVNQLKVISNNLDNIA